MAKGVKAQARMLVLAAGTVAGRTKAQPIEGVMVNGRMVTRDQALALHLAAELAKGGKAERARAAAMVREVERELSAASEAQAVADGVAETVGLMGGAAAGYRAEVAVEGSFVRGRDGQLVRHDGELVVRVERVARVRRDDGLANLLASGALTRDQYETGMLYRVVSAKAAPSARSSLCERERGGSSGSSDAAVWAALERAYAGLRLRLVRAAVGDARACAVLDAVAGQGMTVRSLGGGGDARARDTARLAAALDVADRWLRISDASLKKGVANQGR